MNENYKHKEYNARFDIAHTQLQFDTSVFWHIGILYNLYYNELLEIISLIIILKIALVFNGIMLNIKHYNF